MVRAQGALDAALEERTEPSLRRLAVAAGPALDAVVDVVRAEASARLAVDEPEVDEDGMGAADLARRVDEVVSGLSVLSETEDLQRISPSADGAAVMARLAIGPGPDVGAALDHLAERRIECGPRDAADELDDLARWWERRSQEPTDRSGPDVP